MKARRVVAAAAVVLGIGAGPVSIGASAPPPAPAGHPIERWDDQHGWIGLPAVPTSPPAEAWASTIDARYSHWANGVIVAAEVTGDGEIVQISRIDPDTGEYAWSIDLPVDAGYRHWHFTVNDDGSLVVVDGDEEQGGRESESIAVDADTGELVVPPGSGIRFHDGVRAGDLAVVVSRGATGVDTATGTEVWHYDDDVELLGGQVVLRTWDRPVVGILDPEMGELVWHAEVDEPVVGHVVDGVLLDTPYDADATIRGYDVTSGELRFDTTIPDFGVEGGAYVVPGGNDLAVFYGEGDGGSLAAAAAVDLANGDVRWTADLPSDRVDAYRIDGDVYLAVLSSAGLAFIDGATGGPVSELAVDLAQLEIAGGLVYEQVGGELVARSIPDLEEVWRIDWPEPAHLVAVDDGVVASTGADAWNGDDGPVVLTGFLAP